MQSAVVFYWLKAMSERLKYQSNELSNELPNEVMHGLTSFLTASSGSSMGSPVSTPTYARPCCVAYCTKDESSLKSRHAGEVGRYVWARVMLLLLWARDRP